MPELKTIKKIETINIPCKKCSGMGYLLAYTHVRGGTCFRCEGSRFETITREVEVEESVLTADEQFVADNTQHLDAFQICFTDEKVLKVIAKAADLGILLSPDEVILSA